MPQPLAAAVTLANLASAPAPAAAASAAPPAAAPIDYMDISDSTAARADHALLAPYAAVPIDMGLPAATAPFAGLQLDTSAASTTSATTTTASVAGQKRPLELVELATANPFAALATSSASATSSSDDDVIFANRHLLGQLDASTLLDPHHPDSPYYTAREEGYTELFPRVTDPTSPTLPRRQKRQAEKAREKLLKGATPTTATPGKNRGGRPPGFRKDVHVALIDGRISRLQAQDIREGLAGLTTTLAANRAVAEAAGRLLVTATPATTTTVTAAIIDPGTTAMLQFRAADTIPTHLP